MKAQKIGVKIVCELLDVMVSKKASGGIVVVTAGKYTIDAKKFARDNNIELIDGHL